MSNPTSASKATNRFNELMAKNSIGTGTCSKCQFDDCLLFKTPKGLLCLECTAKLEEGAKFKEDGTAFTCLVDGDVAEFIIEKSGTQPGTPYGSEEHWAEGVLKCPTCGAEQDYSVST